MAHKRRAFSKVLEGLEETNSRRLMRRARTANRLAKITRGKNRRAAYDVKTKALSSLLDRLPHLADVHKDLVLADFVVVELKSTHRSLHFPVSSLAPV